MILLARASAITDLTYIGKLPHLWFCLPGQAKSLMLLTLASSQIYDFACQGKRHHGFCLPWQAPKSVVLLPRASKIIDVGHLGKLTNILFVLPGQAKS
jgi:hypothetical protein